MRRHHRGLLDHPCGRVLACYLVAATALLGALPREGLAALAPTPVAAGERGAARAEDLARLQRVLEQKAVAQRLAELGFSAEEIRGRLEALDDQRLHEVAERLDGLVTGGQGEALAAAFLLAAYVAAFVVVGVGWVIYKLAAAIARSWSAPETSTGEAAPPKEEEMWQAPGTPTGPPGDPLPQSGKDAPPEPPDCKGYRERPGGGNPGIPFNPAAPPPPC